MRCKSCDYPLWQIKARKCPECGAPFLPSDFEYVLNSVKFCCPHCGQAYYGTGDRGHLVPRGFACVSCAQQIDMDEMVLLPAEGVKEEQTRVEVMPWLERGKGPGSPGFLRALFGTIGRAMVGPGRMMRAVPPESPMAPALSFAAITCFCIMMVAIVPFFLFIGLVSILPASRGGGPSTAAAVGSMLATMAGVVVGGTIASIVMALIWAVCSHGLLRMGGKTDFGMGRTIQAILYSSGANVASAVPCFGQYFGWIWWVVSSVFSVKEAQRVSGGRAAFAALTPPLTFLVVFLGGYVALVTWGMSMASSASARAAAAAQSAQSATGPTATIAQALITYAAAHGGHPPGHAIELVFSASVPGVTFVGQSEDAETYSVGGRSLATMDSATKPQEQAIIASAIKALPSGVVAHRVGDFVFTYHGMDFSNADPRLWTVIFWQAKSPSGTSRRVYVGRADGKTESISISSFIVELAAQNEIRVQVGLPPIPHPSTVTHEAPAAAPAPDAGAPK